MEVCNRTTNYNPIVQGILHRTESMADDPEGIIDITLETVVRVRGEQSNPRTSNRKMQRKEGRPYFPIYSGGLRAERPIYSYLRYNLQEQFADSRKMLIEALWLGIPSLTGGSDTTSISARPNFGVVPVPSIFEGTEVVLQSDVMPWIGKHSTKQEVMRTIARFEPASLRRQGILSIALEHTAYFSERLAGLDIGIGDVNNQGPFDIAHQVRGADIFYDIYDDPSFVHTLMEMCATAYVEVFKLIEEAAGRRGRTHIPYCDDSSTLLSERSFVEFSLPYLYRVAKPFEAVHVHYCGKGHLTKHYLECPKVQTINLGQPELYDYDSFIGRLLSAGKTYVGLWPAGPGEGTAESYFGRMLRPLRGRDKGLNFQINGYEFGTDSADLCKLWYEVQDRVLYSDS